MTWNHWKSRAVPVDITIGEITVKGYVSHAKVLKTVREYLELYSLAETYEYHANSETG